METGSNSTGCLSNKAAHHVSTIAYQVHVSCQVYITFNRSSITSQVHEYNLALPGVDAVH